MAQLPTFRVRNNVRLSFGADEGDGPSNPQKSFAIAYVNLKEGLELGKEICVVSRWMRKNGCV